MLKHLFLALLLLLPTALQAQMAAEADSFLRALPAGLQERQAQAVAEAIDGDSAALLAVRNSRNVAAPLPDGVRARYVSPTLRLYAPAERTEGERLPLLIYLHGGGWTFGSINSCARFCGALAASDKVLVLAVDYPLAPTHSSLDVRKACVDAYDFALAHADEWGADAQAISYGGDSSGGNLAIVSAYLQNRRGKDRVHSLVLFYPVTKAYNDRSASWRKYGTGYGLDADLMECFNRSYLGLTGHPKDPLLSPYHLTKRQLRLLPPTLLVAAERDILCDQGRAFCAKAKESGVRVVREQFSGAVHLFITVDGQPTAFARAVERTLRFLEKGKQ